MKDIVFDDYDKEEKYLNECIKLEEAIREICSDADKLEFFLEYIDYDDCHEIISKDVLLRTIRRLFITHEGNPERQFYYIEMLKKLEYMLNNGFNMFVLKQQADEVNFEF